jgi:hypothetical protein
MSELKRSIGNLQEKKSKEIIGMLLERSIPSVLPHPSPPWAETKS